MSDATTRQSWNIATANHNQHKGDQAAFLREGGDTLFPEELALLGELAGKRLVHLQCNSGQDTLSLAKRGAEVLGVDFSSEAVGFACQLSRQSGIFGEFVEAEVVQWLQETSERFDIAFSSYGAVGWLPDLNAWAKGIKRVLKPQGRFVYVEFHPLVWSLGDQADLKGDDYFHDQPFHDPVTDYVALSGETLGALPGSEPLPNEVPATSYQHTLGAIVTALAQAGLILERLEEYPHSNGFKPNVRLQAAPGRRWVWPNGRARVPLMFGLVVRAP